PLVPVEDGDNVFDLRIVTTPGHTPGHIAVLDEALGVLVVGDALTTNDGRPTSYPIGTTEDMEEAQRSVAKLAALDFETLFVGHGEPIQFGAAALVREFLDVCPLDLDLEPPAEAVCRHPMDLQ
ncbi:MAG: MBL fold metallo-hydrolase, partial [Candidatus Limnocylindria bacterium]